MRTNRYGASEAALLRHETYAAGNRRLTLLAGVSVLVAGVAVSIACYALLSKPEPRYFATQVDGGILPLIPLDQPMLNSAQITAFATEAITAALTMDFANYRKDLAAAERYFQQPDGWENFLDALEKSNMLRYIVNNRMVATAVANGATIVASGDYQGTYSWNLQVPVKVTYESSSETAREDLLVELIVRRVPTHKQPEGVGIVRVNVLPNRGS